LGVLCHCAVLEKKQEEAREASERQLEREFDDEVLLQEEMEMEMELDE